MYCTMIINYYFNSLDIGSDINQLDDLRRTPLDMAMQNYLNPELIQWLLVHGGKTREEIEKK